MCPVFFEAVSTIKFLAFKTLDCYHIYIIPYIPRSFFFVYFLLFCFVLFFWFYFFILPFSMAFFRVYLSITWNAASPVQYVKQISSYCQLTDATTAQSVGVVHPQVFMIMKEITLSGWWLD